MHFKSEQLSGGTLTTSQSFSTLTPHQQSTKLLLETFGIHGLT